MIKVVHISSGHHRNELRVHLKQCNSLAAAGYSVNFIVADGGGDAKIGGVQVLDVGVPHGRFQRMLVFPWRLLRRARQINASIYHFHDPELLTIAIALKKSGAKVIYDSHEDVPRSIMSRDWIPFPVRRIVSMCFEFFENFVARRIAYVVGATPFIAKRFSDVGCRAIAINNFPLASEIADVSASRRPMPVICFLGGISRVRGVREIIMALGPLQTRMVLAGPFDSDETREELTQLQGWRNVDYKGNIERKAAVEAMRESMVGMICYLPEPNHVNAFPNKLFEYMAAGLPVVASDFPLWRDIVDGAQCGICVDPSSPEDIRQAISQMINDPEACRRMGENGRRAVLEQYNWSNEEKKLIQLYQGILTSNVAPVSEA
ncbi:glycosyltransferase family 4 protein [Pseudomonas sp. MM211]|uniref:glycosyltransferase family 4 protein n=1 Tax=Pseudomonas sp. MM211 TaxID=2866808 RepID=UPI001CECD9B2|nr:glycosyltransferase family 4 protein [Pseudomonas sp. MM211]UCJ15193.1 glycosyltransferase family 4 protein [Pseudomonas sp. MM211]